MNQVPDARNSHIPDSDNCRNQTNSSVEQQYNDSAGSNNIEDWEHNRDYTHYNTRCSIPGYWD